MMKMIDERRIAVILQEELLIPYLTDLFYTELEKALKAKGRFNAALAGGSTPKKLYSAICSDPRAHSINWSQVYLYYGDERAVPLDHSDSNYKMSLDAGWNKILGVNLVPMKAYLNNQTACHEYEKLLPKHLDLILLGMGDDGHTASLFPDDPLSQITSAPCALGFVSSKNSSRMTLTFPYINKTSKIIVLVTGFSKQKRLKEVLSDKGSLYPAYFIGTPQHPAFFVLDTAAGELLLSSTCG